MLYIFVEGTDDYRFIEKVIKPLLSNKYKGIQPILYRNRKKDYVINFVRSIKSMHEDYFLMADINDCPCISEKKQKQNNIYKNRLDLTNIIIVVREIECWYLAGLDNESCRHLKIPVLTDTDDITKENFNRMIPREYDRLTFMLEILDCFSINFAAKKNRSFEYFMSKLN